MTIGKRLADLRKKANLTQTELGLKLNISAQAISKWENDISEPDISTLRRIAEIYGVTASEIIDSCNAEARSNNESRSDSPFSSLNDIFLTEIDPNQKITTVRYLREMLGIDLTEALNAVKSLPYLISGMVSAEETESVRAYLAEVGAGVIACPSSGVHTYRRIISTTTPPPLPECHDMRNRFIVANITAGIPAIILFILAFFESIVGHGLMLAYCGLATYSFIFLLWYPTFVRKLMSPFRNVVNVMFNGFFQFIGCIILLIPISLFSLFVWLISPINYVFAIKRRIVRMLEEDDDDDIFNPLYSY